VSAGRRFPTLCTRASPMVAGARCFLGYSLLYVQQKRPLIVGSPYLCWTSQLLIFSISLFSRSEWKFQYKGSGENRFSCVGGWWPIVHPVKIPQSAPMQYHRKTQKIDSLFMKKDLLNVGWCSSLIAGYFSYQP
jgi:hypothetical protein